MTRPSGGFLLDLLAPRVFRRLASVPAPQYIVTREATLGQAGPSRIRARSAATAAVSVQQDEEVFDAEAEEGEQRRVAESQGQGVARSSSQAQRKKLMGSPHNSGRSREVEQASTPARAIHESNEGSASRLRWKQHQRESQPPSVAPMPNSASQLAHYDSQQGIMAINASSPNEEYKSTTNASRKHHLPHAFAVANRNRAFNTNNERPPQPAQLFSELSSRPSVSSSKRLLRYAQRMDDKSTESAVRDLMGRLRVAPVDWVGEEGGLSRQRSKARKRISGLYTSRVDVISGNSDDTAGPKCVKEELEGDQAGGAGPSRRPIPPHLHDLRARTNTWARKRWPPGSSADQPTTSKVKSSQDFLRQQHRRILERPPEFRMIDFDDSLRAISDLLDCTDDDRLSLLHLYLAYPAPRHTRIPVILEKQRPTETSTSLPLHSIGRFSNRLESQDVHPNPSSSPNMQLLAHFLRLHSTIRPTRQTLHLIILSALPEHSQHTATLAAHARTRLRIGGIIHFFRAKWGFGPACETWRHITRHAIIAGDRMAAREGWDGWWSARERVVAGPVKGLTEEEEPGGLEEGNQQSPDMTNMPEIQNRSPTPTPDIDATFRFAHTGRHMARWMQVIKWLEKKGWIKRMRLAGVQVDGRTSGVKRGNWEWVPFNSIKISETGSGG